MQTLLFIFGSDVFFGFVFLLSFLSLMCLDEDKPAADAGKCVLWVETLVTHLSLQKIKKTYLRCLMGKKKSTFSRIV